MRRPRLRSLIPGARAPEPSSEAKRADVMTKLRQLLVGMTQMGSQRSEDREVRNLVLGAAKLARSPGKLREAMQGMAEMEAAQVAEASTWMAPDEVAEGKQGRFDACDLRNWLAIAARAGVAAIPAREILSLSAEEYGAAVGAYGLDRDSPRIRRALGTISQAVRSEYSEDEISEARVASVDPQQDQDAIIERLHAAMDDVPEGWMVRSSVCGGDNLKALAGCGVTETFIPEVRFGPDLEIGPGWVRTGNRRMIDIQDKRTMQLYVRNDTAPIAFLARPWVVASRWLEGRDPHRAGTPIDIPGSWPAEWRAFVRKGRVVGVSSYYSWAGRADADSANVALKVRELAQAVVDQAIADGQLPRAMDNVLARRNDKVERAMEANGFNDGDFDCTIDFIEAEEGILLLEAGPGCGILGGGHPCGFAGDFVEIEFEGMPMRWLPTEGVALRNMEHILIGDPKTWSPGKKAGAILTWGEAEALAGGDEA